MRVAARQNVIAVYTRLLDAWNRRSADDFAWLFTYDGNAVGFDGTEMNGRAAVRSMLAKIFADHPTAAYVAKIREVRALARDVVLLRAVVGMVPPGANTIKPDVNAIQSVLFVTENVDWKVSLLHNTPAAYHGRPDAVERLTHELTEVTQTGETVFDPGMRT
jgi:uncharacterized protein (TIGR02246 family)